METQKKKKHSLLWIGLLVLLVLGVIGNLLPSDNEADLTPKTEKTERKTVDDTSSSNDSIAENDTTIADSFSTNDNHEIASFSITMLDVGQGLSILICADDHYLLYDGGGHKSSSYVVSYLKKNSISALDYMVASHYDEDHISGLIGVLNTTTIKKALVPNYVASSKTYLSFVNKLETTGTDYEYPNEGQSYSLGKASIKVLGPNHYNYDDDNESSISLRIQYGSCSCILTGDSTELAERRIIASHKDIQSDIYVVGHHGSPSSSSDAFLDTVSPQYAFISVGKDNHYGHPSERVLDSLKSHHTEIYRTDLQGTVSAFSNGKEWHISTEALNDEASADAPSRLITPPATSSASSVISTYVLNTHTKKYHYPYCASTKSMKKKNMKTVKASPSQLESQGYSPCQNCNP